MKMFAIGLLRILQRSTKASLFREASLVPGLHFLHIPRGAKAADFLLLSYRAPGPEYILTRGMVAFFQSPEPFI